MLICRLPRFGPLSVVLSKSFARNPYVLISRYSSLFHRIYRMEPKKAIVIHEPESDTVDISFRFVSEALKIDRIFNMSRKKDDELSNVLNRMSANIISKTKSKKRKKKDVDEEQPVIPVSMVGVTDSSNQGSYPKEENLPGDMPCYEAFVNLATKSTLIIESAKYVLDLNPPVVKSVELPKCLMAGYPITVSKLKTLFTNNNDCIYRWFKSDIKFEDIKDARAKVSAIKWSQFGVGYSVCVTPEEVGCLLKVVITPCLSHRRGEDIEAISPALVTVGPGECPSDRRHVHTKQPAGDKSLRVISYNILADLYADGDFARTQLFSTCPSYAIDLGYRKQLMIKELLGYNGDLICLQEVDEKVFDNDLHPILADVGFDGSYDAKAGQVTEGVAVFFRKTKLRFLERSRFVLSDELQTNVLFADMWEKLQLNEALKERVSQRTTILQATVFESIEDPSRLIVVGNTHLYFHPNADHIRILQGGICMKILQQIVGLYQTKFSDKEVSLIFCGDFNSTPEFGIYRFMTTQLIDTEDTDWTSCPDECVKGIEISHDFEMESACGLPSYTNYTVGFNGCLDYIFYQTNRFTVKKVIPMPTHEEVTEHTALPSVTFPSDHISIIADLEFKTR